MSNCDCDRCSGRDVRVRIAEDEHERRLEEARREGREQVYARLVGTANEHLAGAMRRHFGDDRPVMRGIVATWPGAPAPTVYKGMDEHARPVVIVTDPVRGATDSTPLLSAFEMAERHLEEVRREALLREEERLVEQLGSLRTDGEGD